MKNLQRYKKDLQELIDRGRGLYAALLLGFPSEQRPEHMQQYIKEMGWDDPGRRDETPSFMEEYQSWYSDALVVVRQLLPERLDDFLDYYKGPEDRKANPYSNYRISDYVLSREVGAIMAGEDTSSYSARPVTSLFRQQLAIVKAASQRLESSLYDLKQLVQADLFDSELEEAEAFIERGFHRAAGAIAGVVMEKHLVHVCESHALELPQRPTIGPLNKILRENDVIGDHESRLIEYLRPMRNVCSHYSTEKDNTEEEVKKCAPDLVEGVKRLVKTLS